MKSDLNLKNKTIKFHKIFLVNRKIFVLIINFLYKFSYFFICFIKKNIMIS